MQSVLADSGVWIATRLKTPGQSQTQEHLVKQCHWWKDPEAMWLDISKATCGMRTAQNISIAQRFGGERCTAAILELLATTEVGLRGRKTRQLTGEEDARAERTEQAEQEGESPSRRATKWGK
jgi:hypothetical protein